MFGAEPKSQNRILAIFLSVLLATIASTGAEQENDLVRHWEQVRSYLDRYGYLQPSPPGASDLRTEEKLRGAVRRMQRFGGLPPTGRLDTRTLGLMRRRRCGMSDLSPAERVRRYAVQGQQWTKKDLTWSIKYWPQSLPPDLVRAEVTRAFKLWSDVSQLNFREIKSLDADIVVSFERGSHGDGFAFDGRGMVLAHAFFPGDGIGGDAHFDAEEPWVDRQPDAGIDGVRLFAVAAHEFGHSLGLSHSSVTGALMNPFYQPVNNNFKLPDDDRFGIQNIYGARNPIQWAPIRPYIPSSTRSPPRSPSKQPVHPGSNAPHTPVATPQKPVTCNTTVDAIAVIRREVFVFKGEYFWRLNSQGMMKDYPAEIGRFWYDKNLKTVDAVYERTQKNKIVFFSGAQYWVFTSNTKDPNYPRPLTDLGLPPDLERIDAVLVWGHNGKTYLFSGEKYWRYDETEGRVELDYPRDMAMWRGVPYNIDAAFKYTDGQSYFFKGRKFWKFNDNLMMVDKRQKIFDLNEHWFGCPSRTEQANKQEGEAEESARTASSSTTFCSSDAILLIISFTMVYLAKHEQLWITVT